MPLTHKVSTNITYGTVAQDTRLAGTPLSIPMRTMTESARVAERSKMLDICEDCHAPSRAAANLDQTDKIKKDVTTCCGTRSCASAASGTTAFLTRCPRTDRRTTREPTAEPPENRPPNPVYATLGPSFVGDGYVLVLGGQQLQGGTSQIEQSLFTTYKYDHVSTFKGACHMNPRVQPLVRLVAPQQDVDIIAGQEASLRRGEDPGFTVTPARVMIARRATFDARARDVGERLDQHVHPGLRGTAAASVAHTYIAPGRYTVRLTCSDTDLVNDALRPLSRSGPRARWACACR